MKNYLEKLLFNKTMINRRFVNKFPTEDYFKFSYFSRSIQLIYLRKI